MPASYADRLTYLGLQRLELRRIHTNLLIMFKLSYGLITCELQLALQYAMRRGLRGHRYKLFIPFARKFALSTSFLYCVVSVGNFLPETCYNVDTYNSCKSKIHDVDFTRFFKDHA